MWTTLLILSGGFLEGGEAAVTSASAAGVDPRWLLPAAVIEADEALPKQLSALAAVRFEAGAGSGAFASVTSFGDLVAIFAPVRGDATAVAQRLSELEKQRPDIARAVLPIFGELIRSTALPNPDWNPDDESRDDGFHLGKPMMLRDDLGEPWKGLDDDDVLQQGAVLIFADLATIKTVERDYPAYFKRAGQTYEDIHAVEGSYRRGKALEIGAFGTHQLYFRCDLPFPFSHYECDLVVVDRLDAHGNPRCDVYSTSADFHWLAGVDTYVPVLDSQGHRLCWMIVRQFGFDLDDTPDSDSDREAALRSSLCNLKRDAERRCGSAPMPAQEDWITVLQKH